MTQVKRIILGSVAALVSATSANAADLPGAEPVDYVKVCDVKGSSGFFTIPGTETCLQIGGYARLEMTSGELVRSAAARGEADTANRTGYRVRTRLWFDARTETEYGTVRTFVRLQLQRETGAVGQPAGISSARTGLSAPDTIFDQAFVQFAGLTAGQADSFWDFRAYATFQQPFVSDRTVPLLAYTAKLGDVAATLSLEDPSGRSRNDTNAFPSAGQEVPDIVANLKVKQSWGDAQVSGVAHRINPKSNVGPLPFAGALPGENSRTGDTDWGWGVLAGLKLNLPTANTSDGVGDAFWAQAAHVDGPGFNYIGIGDQNIGSGTTQNLVTTFQPLRDYVLVDGETKRTRLTNANIGGLHYWSPKWRSAFQGSYLRVDYRAIDADWTAYTLTGNLIWSPVKKLDLGAELVYVKNLRKADVGYLGSRDDDAFVGRLRVQRDF